MVVLLPNTMKWASNHFVFSIFLHNFFNSKHFLRKEIYIFYSKNGTHLKIYNEYNNKHSSETITKRLFMAFNFHFVRSAYQIRFDMRASICIRKKRLKRRALDPNLYGIQSKNLKERMMCTIFFLEQYNFQSKTKSNHFFP